MAHLRVRVAREQRNALRELAARRRASVSQLLRQLITTELEEAEQSRAALLDEAAIRDMAILIAVELGLKLQELKLPGGTANSREMLEAAARAAMDRLEMVEASLERVRR